MTDDYEQDVRYRRVFWRIIFDVVDHTIRLRQEFTCWHKVRDRVDDGGTSDWSDPYWYRADRLMVNLQYRIVGRVAIAHDHVVFDGGYLECETYDWTPFALTCLDGQPGEMSELIAGENVAIRADVRLRKPQPGGAYPLFHLQQVGNPPVMLTQTIPGPRPDLVMVHWDIDARPHDSSMPYRIRPSVDWHRVRVYQDDGGVFKFWSDSVPLGNSAIVSATDPPAFSFDLVPRTFTIGAAPNRRTKVLETLEGDIAYLEFDPNSSCGSCTQ